MEKYTNIHHLIQRGHYKQTIFLDNEDYLKFLSLMLKYKDKYNIEIITYCLMPNHYHILAKGLDISIFMQMLNRMYSCYFNKKYDKIGTLYQGKYTNVNIQNKDVFLIVFKYILNNPKEPENYPWSGYADIRKTPNPDWNINIKEAKNELLTGYSNPKLAIEILGGVNNVLNYIKKEPEN